MERKLGRRMAWLQLPYDMIWETLSWLPVKSLLRFKVVCKQWFGLITNPDTQFLKLHVSQLFRSKPGILVVRKNLQETDTQFYYAQDYTSCNNLTKFQLPFPTHDYRVVNVCNGLVCFTDFFLEHDANAYVWNPITGDHTTLPSSSSNPSYLLPGVEGYDRFSQVDIMYGFGFVPVSNVYKAIRFVSAFPKEVGGECDSHVTVYTLGEDSSWRPLPSIPYNISLGNHSSALVNGVLHWFGPMLNQWNLENSPKLFLISFNIQQETFKEISQPDEISSNNGLNRKVGVLGGLLSIFCSLEHEDFINIEIWVMGVYDDADSWRKHCKIADPRGPGRSMTLLGDANSREIIISRDDWELFSYDLKTDKLDKLHSFDSNVWETHFFKGSLLSPPKLSTEPAGQPHD